MIGFHCDYTFVKANFSFFSLFFPSFTLPLRNFELAGIIWELLIWWPLIESNSQITICLKASDLALTSIIFMILLPQSFYLEWVYLLLCKINSKRTKINGKLNSGWWLLRASELLFFHDKDIAGKSFGIGWRGW